MALPFIPIIPLIKIILLGSLKLIFLLFGALFFPVFSLRFILTGASSMLLPALDWLEGNGQIDSERHQAVLADLDALSQVEFNRSEARRLLFKLIKKTVGNMVVAVLAFPGNLVRFVRGLLNDSRH